LSGCVYYNRSPSFEEPQEFLMTASLFRRLAFVVLAVSCSFSASGCGKSLFTDSSRDSVRRSQIDKYWGGDSAVEATNNRRKSGDMGFGYPSGSGN
jgi:hypothetical protein